MLQKFFTVPFATGGDLTVVADAVDATGLVTFSQGWGPYYQQDPADDPTTAKDVDRASTNYIFNVITTALAAIQAVSTAEWITSDNNDGTPYPYVKGAQVRYSATPTTGPWLYYVSLTDNNVDTPGATANWQVVLTTESSGSQALAGTDGTTVMTPRRVKAAIDQGVVPLGVQVGMVAFFAAITVQTGYLPADGSLVSRTTFAALFTYMGTTFGAGDGSTTFQLPDMRGKFPRAFDNGAGIDPGRMFGSYIADMIKSHNHGVTDPGHNHTLINPSHNHGLNDPGHSHLYDYGPNRPPQSGGDTPCWSGDANTNTAASTTGITLAAATTAVSATASTTGISTQNQSGGGTETAPKNVALLCCIKY